MERWSGGVMGGDGEKSEIRKPKSETVLNHPDVGIGAGADTEFTEERRAQCRLRPDLGVGVNAALQSFILLFSYSLSCLFHLLPLRPR
jgi:hypothetical protein